MKNMKIMKIVAMCLAVMLVISAGYFFGDKALKATDDAGDYAEPAPAPVEEVQQVEAPAAVEAPVEEAAAEAPVEAPAEAAETPAEEPGSEEPVVSAAELNVYTVRFFGMDGAQIGEEQQVVEGSMALAPEAPSVEGFAFSGWDKSFASVTSNLDVNALYTEIGEEPDEEAEELSVEIWFEYEGELQIGTEVIWKSSVTGAKDGAAIVYQWQVNKGTAWENIQDANESTYKMTITEENSGWQWRLFADAV